MGSLYRIGLFPKAARSEPTAEYELPDFRLGDDYSFKAMIKPKRLLIVDDEPDLLSSKSRIMQFQGYSVNVAGNGLEAIEKARQTKPDGVLLDIRIPGIDGVETCRRLRSVCPETFVIFISGFSDRLDEAHKENPLGVLPKPVDLDVLCSLIKEGLVGG